MSHDERWQVTDFKIGLDYAFKPVDFSKSYYHWPRRAGKATMNVEQITKNYFKAMSTLNESSTHPDIGKHVSAISYGRICSGILIAVDDENSEPRYLVKLDRGQQGADHSSSLCSAGRPSIRSQIHNLNDLKNASWCHSYTLTPQPMKTLETLEVGDIIVSGNSYAKILTVLGGEGLARTYVRSYYYSELGKITDLPAASEDCIRTAQGLRNESWRPYEAPQVTEVTLDEVAQRMGIPVSQLRIKE
jgi:hypothetical protein